MYIARFCMVYPRQLLVGYAGESDFLRNDGGTGDSVNQGHGLPEGLLHWKSTPTVSVNSGQNTEVRWQLVNCALWLYNPQRLFTSAVASDSART